MATTTYGTPYVSGTDLVANWPAASLTVANSIDAAGYYVGRGINAQTASYTTVLTDAGKTVSMTNAGATTLTIPANSSVAYVVGSRINILNLGAGACTPTAGAGVTISGTITALATNGSAALVKTATNTWSYIPSGAGGKILQVVNVTYNTATSSTSTSYADTGLTATITPSSASSKVLAIISVAGVFKSSGNAGTGVDIQLVRTSTGIGVFGVSVMRNETNANNSGGNASASILDAPSTTSATTYKAQFKTNNSGQTITVQNDSAVSTLTLMEVAA